MWALLHSKWRFLSLLVDLPVDFRVFSVQVPITFPSLDVLFLSR
jgi:hypothetical protein